MPIRNASKTAATPVPRRPKTASTAPVPAKKPAAPAPKRAAAAGAPAVATTMHMGGAPAHAPRRAGGMGSGAVPGGHMSECLTDFLDVLADPFDTPAQACLPAEPCFPSQKVKVWSKSYFVVPTGGSLGWILVNPGLLAANDAGGVYCTTGTAGAPTTLAESGTGVAALNSNAPYTGAQITGGIGLSVRLVAFGLRVRSRSNAMTRDGDIMGLVQPSHESLVGVSHDGLLAYDGVSRERNGEGWTSYKLAPAFPSEFSFTSEVSAFDSCVGLYLQGAAAQAVDFEVVAHFEYIGTVTNPMQSESMLDPVGGPVALSMLVNAPGIVTHSAVTSAHLKTAVMSRVSMDTTLPHPEQARGVAAGRRAYAALPYNPEPGKVLSHVARHVASTAAAHAFKHGHKLLSSGVADFASDAFGGSVAEDVLALVLGLF